MHQELDSVFLGIPGFESGSGGTLFFVFFRLLFKLVGE